MDKVNEHIVTFYSQNNKITMKANILFLFLLLFFLACNTTPNNSTADQEPKAEASSDSGVSIEPFANSYAFSDAKINGFSFKNGKFNFNVEGEKYKLGEQTPDVEQKVCANSGKGQHIHLIVDNAPYAAKYTADFDYSIGDGEHYLLAFLSRSYHESIKTNDAHVAKKVSIKGNTITASEDINEPMVFYSRPKGTYTGANDTKRVMLDFYLKNTTISPTGNKVKADINGQVLLIDKWQPYYLDGLPMGENTITLTLVDKDGEKIDTPLNPVTRTFTLMPEKPTAQ